MKSPLVAVLVETVFRYPATNRKLYTEEGLFLICGYITSVSMLATIALPDRSLFSLS